MLRTFKSACACMRSQCPCRHDRRGPPPRHGASACGWRRALVHRSRGKAWRQRQATRSARQSMRQPMRQRVCSPCLPEAPRGRADPRPRGQLTHTVPLCKAAADDEGDARGRAEDGALSSRCGVTERRRPGVASVASDATPARPCAIQKRLCLAFGVAPMHSDGF